MGVGHRVLDVATGRGAVLFPAADCAGPSGEVIGIDLSESMVEAAAAEITQRSVAGQVLRMDAEQLEFANASFDRVLCGFGVMFFPSQDRALAECFRVLKPSGRVGVSTWKVTQVDDLGAVLHGLGLSSVRAPGWITESERLSALLQTAHFTDVQVIEASETFLYADLEQYWEAAMTTGLRRDLVNLSEDDAVRVRQLLAARLQDRLQSDGLHVTATALLAVGDKR